MHGFGMEKWMTLQCRQSSSQEFYWLERTEGYRHRDLSMNHPNLAIWWVVVLVSSADFTATSELVICPVVLRNQLCHHQPQKLKVREYAGSVISTPVSRLRSRPLLMPFSTALRAWKKLHRTCTRIPHRRLWWCRIMQDPSAGANLRYGDLFSVVRGKSEVALTDQSWQKDV